MLVSDTLQMAHAGKCCAHKCCSVHWLSTAERLNLVHSQESQRKQQITQLAARVAELEADLRYSRLTPHLPLGAPSSVSWVRRDLMHGCMRACTAWQAHAAVRSQPHSGACGMPEPVDAG